MGNIDWSSFLRVDLATVRQDHDLVDKLVGEFGSQNVDFDSPEANDMNNIRKLFDVVKEVLLFKEEQVYVAEDEVAKLIQENDMAKEEVQQLRKHTGSGERSLLAEISRLEDRNHVLEKELDDMSNKYTSQCKQNDDLVKQLQSSESNIAGLKRDVERAKNDAKDLHRQVEAQRDRLTIRQDRENFDQSRKLTEEVNNYLKEIDILERENKDLHNKIVIVEKEVETATSEMNTMAGDYNHLKQVLEDTDRVLDDVRRERDMLRAQCEDLQTQLQMKDKSDDHLTLALNQKIEEWKSLLIGKDKEIADREAIITELQRKLQANNMDTEKTTVTDLMHVVKEKDEKIKELKGKLDQATAEMKIVTEKIEDIKKRSKDEFPSLRQQAQIQELSKTLRQEQISTIKERGRVERAEEDAAEKDKTISELMSRIMQYEKGQYGLPEAVQEIKEYRGQVRMRDKNIEDITSQLNKVQIEADNLEAENEELRERLGLDPKVPLDGDALRKKQRVKQEQANALNRQLTKEVERLEEERLNLKKQLRKQAMHRGERAVEIGLTAEDLAIAEEVAVAVNVDGIANAPSNQLVSDYAQLRKSQGVYQEQVALYKRESEHNQEKLQQVTQDKDKIKEENKYLRDGLNELLEAMKGKELQPGQEIKIPSLERLIEILEARSSTGEVDLSLGFKNQVQQLRGQNMELKSELKIVRDELKSVSIDCAKKENIIENKNSEIENLREAGLGIVKINPLQLPEGIKPSSSDIIASLNEFIIQILQDMTNKEELVQTMEKELENSKRKLLILNHQLGIVYKEYQEEKEETQKQISLLKEEQMKMQTQRGQDAARIKEFEDLLKTLDQNPDHIQSRLADLVRKVTTLKVNERSLTRRYTILLEVEGNIRKENDKLQKDITDMENAVTERLGYLSRFRDFASYKIAALQKALDESVPESELLLANKQYNEIAAKYRDLLQRENSLVARSVRTDELEFEVKRLQEIESELARQLQLTKERAFALEQSLKQLLSQGNSGGQDLDTLVNDESVITMARQLATLEMKELNERQKADHASRRCEHLKSMLNELETRNNELEEKFSSLTQQSLESQRIERELREELLNAIPEKIGRQQTAYIQQLEASDATLKLEVSKLKEIAEVATGQVKTLTRKQQSQEKELTAVRRQLYDLQMETDEKTVIAKLYQHILALQGSEATAVYKLERAEAKVKGYEIQMLHLEHKIDDREQTLSQSKSDARTKARFLKKTIQDLRRQFSGALPLLKQEKFSQTLRILEEGKLGVQQELRKIREQSQGAALKVAELKMRNDGLEELLATLKDKKGAEKVMEWHTRISDIRLQDLKLRRQIEHLQREIDNQESAIEQREKTILILEEQLVVQAKDFEERQLTWEQHEVELERIILRLEKQQDELVEATQRFEEATGSVPDKSLPVADQLEHAVRKIREHVKTIIVTKAEASKVKKEFVDVKEKLQNTETENMKKDRIINELKLRLPFDERIVTTYDKVTIKAEDRGSKIEMAKAELALQVAQTTVGSLQLILQKKEESLAKYQNMLKAARDELRTQDETYKQELKVLQDRLQLERSEHVRKIKQTHLKYVNDAEPEAQPVEHLQRVSKLEEVVTEQDNAMGTLATKYKSAIEDVKKIKATAEKRLSSLKGEMKALEEKHVKEREDMSRELSSRDQEISELKQEINSLNQDLKEAKEANERAPSKTMRNLVEKLRNQLALKEKQQKTLSQALLRLRSDMVSNAESNLQEQAHKMGEEINIQQIVDSRTASLNDDINALQAKVKKLQREVRDKVESEEELEQKVSELQSDVVRKEDALRKVATELKQREDLEEEVTELRARNKLLEKFKGEADKLKKQLLVLQSETITPVVENVVTSELEPNFDAGKEELPPKKDSAEEVQRWAENKQWQQRTEKLKSRLKERTDELQKVKSEAQMLRNIISRQDKDKRPTLPYNTRVQERVDTVSNQSVIAQKEIQELKSDIFHLQSENNELKSIIAMKEEELKLQRYQQKDAPENARVSFEVPERDTDGQTNAQTTSALPEQSWQKELLELRKENMELNFENERCARDVPRLKGRVQDLEEYVDVLKAEIDSHRKKERSRKAAPGSIPGQSVEDMERVIAAMRRVIERLHTENENLQKRAGKNVATDLTRQNKQLKQEIQRLKSNSVTKSDQTTNMAKGTSKLIQDNEQLRKDLQEEKERSEDLRLKISKLKKSLGQSEKGQKEVDVPTRAENVKDSLSNPAKVVVRYEEKIKGLQVESERKSQLLKELKDFLKVAGEKEQKLIEDNERYKRLLSELETDQLDLEETGDTQKVLQQAKLKIKRQEAEKQELLHDLEVLKELVGSSKSQLGDEAQLTEGNSSTEFELRSKIKVLEDDFDELSRENRRLREELSGFDPAFFEELEDLKYNYKKSVERNVLYEKQLQHLSKRFGVHVNIPSDDDF